MVLTKPAKIAVVGAGNMGEAIIIGLLKSGVYSPQDLRVVEAIESRRKYITETYHIECVDLKDAVTFANASIIAVEPRHLEEVLEQIKPALTNVKVLISIVAGVMLDTYRKHLPKDIAVVRVIPNVTCMVREAMIGICPSANTTKEQLETVKSILGQLGQVLLLDEKQLNSITGFVGSGPAYVSVMIEAMADAGVRLGISKDKSLLMAAQTMLGTAKLVVETKEHPAKIKDRVTTPGGITAEGLLELEKGGLRATIISAISKAAEKTEAVGKQSR
jgi:pyrroline-5-carboxylate reductase